LPTSSSISNALREFAEDPPAWGELDPRSGLDRVLNERYCILFGGGRYVHVCRLRLDPDGVAEVLHEVRAEVTRRGAQHTRWNVGSSATPVDLVDRLVAHGLVPEDHAAALVAVDEPPRAPDGVEARRVRNLEEFELAEAIMARVFRDEPPEPGAEERFEREREGQGARDYLAFADGEPVGAGRMFMQDGDPAAVLVAGGVLEHARGRGAYRALVRARWEDAAVAGFHALTVQAGPMSRPVLERSGFTTVAEIEVLADPAC
jgi:hypothetical protein